MDHKEIFDRLWAQYSGENPSADKIRKLFLQRCDRVVNDHVAFRTINDSRVNIEVLARPFKELGYQPVGEYEFKAKKLKARHYEIPGEEEAPRVFISELLLEEFSDFLQDTLKEHLDRLPASQVQSPELIHSGSVFHPLSYEVYRRLQKESEYAAWVYVWGFRANHFTVSVNHLESLASLEEVNGYLLDQGYELNASGGKIKGSPDLLLEQSSTLADRVEVKFREGLKVIPSCYYEFARRYPDSDGKLFSGFIADSADRIFESTDFR